MTKLQLKLNCANLLIHAGFDEALVAEVLIEQIQEDLNIVNNEKRSNDMNWVFLGRKVCQNTHIDSPIKINDDAAWYEKYNGFMTEQP
jgi:hypothetical protein